MCPWETKLNVTNLIKHRNKTEISYTLNLRHNTHLGLPQNPLRTYFCEMSRSGNFCRKTHFVCYQVFWQFRMSLRVSITSQRKVCILFAYIRRRGKILLLELYCSKVLKFPSWTLVKLKNYTCLWNKLIILWWTYIFDNSALNNFVF